MYMPCFIVQPQAYSMSESEWSLKKALKRSHLEVVEQTIKMEQHILDANAGKQLS